MSEWAYLAVVPIAAAAVLQRATGLGFALVAAPFLILLFGPESAVVLVNACGIVAAGTGAVADGRHVDRRRLTLLVIPAVVGIVLGVLILGLLSRPVLQIVIGAILGIGLLLTALVPVGAEPAKPRFAATAGTGLAVGMGAALAGLPGPPVAVYARLTGWQGKSLFATLQVLFLATATTALSMKLLTGGELPVAPWPFWVAIAVALIAGLVAGHFASRALSPRVGWLLVFWIAVVGTAITIVDGIARLAQA